MDAFEPIRNSASCLHDELVASGTNPLNPSDLVRAAVHRLDLELVELPAHDPALKGARALFDEQSGTICCEMAGEPSERALLVAHEIGHAKIHSTTSSCSKDDIDISRSTETAPVGLQRVEDYGVRERRELQANVFAREFLFPRTLARRLYLDEELGVSEITNRTGLSKNLIRQQLLDALLLPSPSASAIPDTSSQQPERPDPAQERAAAHRGSPFQLQAGPGTGKTKTLVNRVLSLIAEDIDPASILVLTFSNRAAKELAERIAAAAPDAAQRVWIGTFHAFGLDLVRRYHDRLGLSATPTLFDRSDAIEVLEEILPTLSLVHYRNLWDPEMILREIVAAISRAKDEVADPIRYRLLAQAMLNEASDDDTRRAAEKCLEIASIYELYERALHNHKALDFGDLIMRPTLLLESDPDLRRAIQFRHRHVIVDEYQDVNRASGRMLKAVAGNGTRLWVVGDSRQSIYRFRGASSTNMTAFSQEYPEAKIDQLSINYRSTEQIVDSFVAISKHMGASQTMLPLALTANRGAGPGVPEIRRYGTPDDEAEGVAGSICELETAGVRLRDQAVLCRTNKRLNEIAAALEARGIPVLHLGSLFERDEVRDLLALLSFAVDPFGDGLTRIGAMARYSLSLQDVYLLTQALRSAGQRASAALPNLVHLPGLSLNGVTGLSLLVSDLAGLSISSSAWEYLTTYLLDRSTFLRDIAQHGSVMVSMRAVAIWQFMNFVRDQVPVGSNLQIQRTLDRVRQLVLLAEERDLRQVPAAALHLEAVRLMSVHGSKGLEFEAVHIPSLTVASFPLSNRGQRCPPPVGMIDGATDITIAEEAKQSQEREEQCLFFVAVSRARTHLRLHLSQRQNNGKNRSPSHFLKWITGHLATETAHPAKISLPDGAPTTIAINIIHSTDFQITISRLRSYEKCPRRFFYTHVLGLAGARKSTAFTRTHDCLHELIRWLADARHSEDPTQEAAEAAFEMIWQARGPISHGFEYDYRQLATRLIASLVSSCAGRRYRNAEPLVLDFPNGRVIVEPDEMDSLPDGSIRLRHLNTGRKRTDEYDRLEYTLYHLAGQEHFGTNYVVEAFHLTDGIVEPVNITEQKMSNRRDNANTMIGNIASGNFPIEVDATICPRCPHFFLCDALPQGPLTLP